jgi:geranylgeranyl reductase family protein
VFATDGVWDVAVVGAGPAGATAARVAAAAGRRVVLLERFAIPRYKTCGGGLLDRSVRAVPPEVQLPVRARATALTFTCQGRLERTRKAPGPIINMVQRDEFDAALVKAAITAGAVVCETAVVTRLTQEQDVVCLSTRDHGTIRARAVVGADGSAGRCAGYVGVQFDQVDLGLELEIPTPPDQRDFWAGRALIDWGPIPGSYGWVFPKGDQLSVGVIAARGSGEQARNYLADFLARLHLDQAEPTTNSGHLTRCRSEDAPLFRGRVLVAGDAAGMLDPWSREGISFALRSGAMAGHAAAQLSQATSDDEAASALTGYADSISSALVPEMQAGWALMQAFRRHPWAFHMAIILVPHAWNLFASVLCGQTSVAHITSRRFVRFALAVLSPRENSALHLRSRLPRTQAR